MPSPINASRETLERAADFTEALAGLAGTDKSVKVVGH
jgi:hypothetical protein